MLMHATASTIPLAPAAPLEPSPSAQSSTATATWKSWLSPKAMASQQRQRRRRQEEREGDENDDEFGNQSTPLHRRQQQKQRYRSTSFDETGTASDKPSSSHLLYKEGATKIIHPVVDNSLTPVDDQHQNSLLATFLLHLNSLLPEYCHHLASTSEDTVNSINDASKAIGVLERGVDTLYMTYGSTNNHVHNFHETSKGGTATSAPSSPLLSQRTGLSPLMPSKIYNRSATSTTKDKLLLSPLHPSATGFAVGSGAMKWNTAIVESEWERFISPFMNLVGVECLYARMEHVLDPERCNTQAPVTAKGGSRGATTNDRIDRKEKTSVFDRQEPNTSTSTHRNVHPPQLFPHPGANNDSSKLGSRRLIAIYRQIREDLIIVGEYLCDPVLGARVGDSTSSNTNNAVSSTLSTVAKLPLPPLVSGRIISPTDATRSKSLTLAPLSSSPSELQGDISKARSADMNYNERRELAAISFRETLDALIGFIDARCVLIRIHAVLCFQQKSLSHCISTTGEVGEDGSPMIMNNQISDAGRERRRKWSALAEQCQNALHPLSTLVTKDDDRCIPKLAVSNIEHEVKCLELVLTSIDRLLECDLFQCVLSIRKLSVLLEQISHQQSCLPLMYIRSSLPKLLAIMHIFFADASPVQIVPSPSPPISQSAISHHSFVKKQTSSAAKKTNFVVLINEFLRNNSSGQPLAVVVAVLKAPQTGGTLPSEEQTSKRGEVNNNSNCSRWKPLYVSSSLNNEGSGEAKEQQTTGWPLRTWAQVEELLSKHSSSDPVKYSIESVAPGDIRGANLSPSRKEYCHVSSISYSLCLVVIQGVGSAKWQSSSDNRIHHFLRNTAPQLCMENLLSVDVVIRLKSEIFAIKDSKQLRGSDTVQPLSLWSESGWSASQRKEVLYSLGLRRKHSPTIIAPLKSPYVKRQIRKLGRQRQKKTSNRGHFEFFLGPSISNLL